MKSTTITRGIVALVCIVGIWLIFKEFEGTRFKTQQYESKIDSLAVEIKGLHNQNDSLETTIQVEEEKNQQLVEKASNLKNTIKDLKESNEHLKANNYKPSEVDSAFASRYEGQYKVVSKDTTHLPLPVSRAVLVDLYDFDRTKNIVLHEDSLINTLQSTVEGKDKVIVTLRTKEENYNSIIQKQVEQQENYKIMVEGLKGDIRKLDRKNKLNKLTKFGMGVLIIGLAATHK